MADHITAGDRRPSTIFAPGGLAWVPMPDLPRGPAREVFEAILRVSRGCQETTAPDRVIAKVCGRSGRFVQKGLGLLEDLGFIQRERHGQHGGRRLRVIVSLAGRGGVKALERSCRTHSHAGSAPIRTAVPASSLGRDTNQETSGSSVRLAGGQPSEPEEETVDREVLALVDRFFAKSLEKNGDSEWQRASQGMRRSKTVV